MADNDDKIKISELDPALQLDNTSETVINKEVSGNWVTFKMTIATLAAHILEVFASSSLRTTNKTVVGAINELQQGGGGGGSSTLAGLTDVDISSPTNNQVLKYDAASDKWVNGAGGGSSGDHITLTQAEYDALVQAGTVDPDAFYFIKDTNGDGQSFQPVIYSLEEREVGVWADGRPLYEKTYYNAGAVTGLVAIPHGISDLERVVSFKGSVLDSNATPSDYTRYSLPRVAVDGYNIGLDVVSDTAIRVAVPSIFGTRLYGWYVTIQYIKSSDTPGSGTWTPQGVPAVHYSTDEHVVGTWVDGSTLYEKTINFGALPDSSEKSVAHNISNVDKIWISDGFVFTSSNTFYGLVHTAGSSQNMQFAWDTNVDRTNVTIETFSDRTSLNAYITVRYTKTST